MKKIIYLLIIAITLCISCNKSNNKNMKEDNKWEGINYTREELNEKLNMGLNPTGTHFWEEFSHLQEYFYLDAKESEMLGYWYGFHDGSQNRTYTFFPNRLFVLNFVWQDYRLRENPEKYLDKGAGVWNIRDNKVYAKIYFFITEVEGQKSKELLFTKPYEIEIIDMNYIDQAGYSRRPFNGFEMSNELKELVVAPKNVDDDYLMARNIYSYDLYTWKKQYGYLELVPEMVEFGIDGLDIIRNPEYIKRYIWDLWP
ncbi:MAG: hypothetical protein FWG99_11890 [Treponema sp.]|nr:hypothetical protein [Treponema sp.]